MDNTHYTGRSAAARHCATVYVGNLSWQTTEDDLAALFEGLGPLVNVRVIQNSQTGRSRGYGFVELGEAKCVAEAVATLDGCEFDGRKLLVRRARPRPPPY
jgi:RNA recognition motif-containing protein